VVNRLRELVGNLVRFLRLIQVTEIDLRGVTVTSLVQVFDHAVVVLQRTRNVADHVSIGVTAQDAGLGRGVVGNTANIDPANAGDF